MRVTKKVALQQITPWYDNPSKIPWPFGEGIFALIILDFVQKTSYKNLDFVQKSSYKNLDFVQKVVFLPADFIVNSQ